MPSVVEFYHQSHYGTRYGVVDAAHKNGHKGFDIKGWRAGTRIPSYVRGVVLKRGTDATYGNYVTVALADGHRAYFCHLQNLSTAATVGTPINLGSDIGPLGNTGYSSGPHLHTGIGIGDDPQDYLGLEDPLPWIESAKTATASPTKPIPLPPSPEPQEEDDMFAPKVIIRLEPNWPPEWSLVAPSFVGATEKERGYLVTGDSAVGVAWARMYAGGAGHEHARVNRADYITIQEQARILHAQYLADLERRRA